MENKEWCENFIQSLEPETLQGIRRYAQRTDTLQVGFEKAFKGFQQEALRKAKQIESRVSVKLELNELNTLKVKRIRLKTLIKFQESSGKIDEHIIHHCNILLGKLYFEKESCIDDLKLAKEMVTYFENKFLESLD